MPLLRTRLVVPLVLAICGLTANNPAAAPSPTLSRLVTAGKAPTAALLAEDSSGVRFETTGPGIGRPYHFRAGSITKTFIATVVLQLAAEGRLALDAPVSAHVPDLLPPPLGQRVTLRHLLTHTSGLPDHVPSSAPIRPEDAVRTALATRAPAAPGSYAYSNTNYVLLGQIVQRVTGRSYASEAHRRIITPLSLTGTSFPGARTTLPAPYSPAYDSAGRDVTVLDPRVAGAAGELISTLDDLNRFYAALLGGRLLPSHQLRALLDTTPTHGIYGMGLYPAELSCGVTVWGHNGRVPGSYVRTAATPDGRHVITFRTDTDTLAATPGGSSLEPSLLEAEFCPPP
ncbi:serine hydrolase domain-containing protein [Streptomyces sp. TRM49041]|uniref:serine hydrolase domain-containing protein n=1 Tax=Streptomyces sp. TRM49041 TaxID=2603216 RepID=UPI0011EEF56F|nr:serine hydrolase domain-containing protein [Streptomyces sp. TRM49041]